MLRNFTEALFIMVNWRKLKPNSAIELWVRGADAIDSEQHQGPVHTEERSKDNETCE